MALNRMNTRNAIIFYRGYAFRYALLGPAGSLFLCGVSILSLCLYHHTMIMIYEM